MRPGAICRRQPHPWEAAAVRPRAASRPSSSHTGATHGGRLRCGWRGGHGSHGGAAGRAAIRSALLPARRVPSHSPAEPRRSRGGGAASPVPGAGWRRARLPGTGLGAPPAGNPRDSPGRRARSLLARSRRLPPETWQDSPGVLTLSATRVLSGLGQVS